MAMLNIGLAKADITPHAGIGPSGFGKRIPPSLGLAVAPTGHFA